MESYRRFQLPLGVAMLAGGLAFQAVTTGIMLKLAQTALLCGVYAILSYDLRGRHFPPEATGRRAEWRKVLFPRSEHELSRPKREPQRSVNGYTLEDVNRVLSPDPERRGAVMAIGFLIVAIGFVWMRDEPRVPAQVPSIPGVTSQRADDGAAAHPGLTERTRR